MTLPSFPNDVLAASYKVSEKIYEEIASKNAKFRKVYEPWKKFRDEQVQWFSIAEGRFDNFMTSVQRASQRAARSDEEVTLNSRPTGGFLSLPGLGG